MHLLGRWAARIQVPETGPDKIYHVQIEGEASQELLKGMTRGTTTEGDFSKLPRFRAPMETRRQIRRLLSVQGRGAGILS
jgi:16S rRNA U516 pseudouridylate synthase RsuA-like enzyme